MMNKEDFLALCGQDYDQWSKSNADNTDPYEYERSIDELMTQLGRRLMQLSAGEIPGDHRKKNDSHAVRLH